MKYFLCIGQSNMASGAMEADEPNTLEGVKILNGESEWVDSVQYLNMYTTATFRRFAKEEDSTRRGIAWTFSKIIQSELFKNETFGLIHNAKGGSSLFRNWGGVGGTGDLCLQQTLTRLNDLEAKHPARDEIIGILWHQGEADRSNLNYNYALRIFIEDWRKYFNKPNLPFIIGQLMPGSIQPNYVGFNQRIYEMKNHSNVGIASSVGCKDSGDAVHFDGESFTLLGTNYANAFLEIERKKCFGIYDHEENCCSGHGSCVNNECVCKIGFAGANCDTSSVAVSAAVISIVGIPLIFVAVVVIVMVIIFAFIILKPKNENSNENELETKN